MFIFSSVRRKKGCDFAAKIWRFRVFSNWNRAKADFMRFPPAMASGKPKFCFFSAQALLFYTKSQAIILRRLRVLLSFWLFFWQQVSFLPLFALLERFQPFLRLPLSLRVSLPQRSLLRGRRSTFRS